MVAEGNGVVFSNRVVTYWLHIKIKKKDVHSKIFTGYQIIIEEDEYNHNTWNIQ